MRVKDHLNLERRRFFGLCGAAVALVSSPSIVSASTSSPKGVRSLSLHSINTGEKIKADYWIDGQYQPEVLEQLNHIMRDHRCDKVCAIDHSLFDLLNQLTTKLGTNKEIEIISAYRAPESNAQMRNKSKGVAKKSYHIKGMAADIRIPGRSLGDLYRSARSLKEGGVAYYGKSRFVHVDVGPVRTWGAKPKA